MLAPPIAAVVSVAVAVGLATGGPAGEENLPDVPAGVAWRWDDALPLNEAAPPGRAAAPDGGRFLFESRQWHAPSVRRVDARGKAMWRRTITQPPADSAVLVLDGDTLYAALYLGSASGCRVLALDARTGAVRWDAHLHGIGLVAHSAYGNHVQMRVEAAGLVVYGNEWHGRYVEVLRPRDGAFVGHRVFRAPRAPVTGASGG